MTVDVTVAATAHVKTVVVTAAKDAMARGQNPVTAVGMAVVMVAEAAVAVAVAGAVAGVNAETARCKFRARALDRASASALTQKADPSHWMLLAHLA